MTDLSSADSPDPADIQRFEVESADVGKRLDAFLVERFPGATRVRVQQGITAGLALVNGQARKPSYKLRANQTVEFRLPEAAAEGPQPEPIQLDLLYEDDAIAVVNKPPQMVVHPAKGHWSGTLASALVHHFQQLSKHGGSSRPGIIHRLDRDTSGAIVIAKTDEAHVSLAEQFQNRTVEKQYLAIVAGCPDHDRDLIDHPIGDHPSHREKKALRIDHPSSREAQTFYEVLERFPGLAVVRAFPKTGRTHQIRLHLAHIRCPVLCDKLYGGRSQFTAGELRTYCRAPQVASELADDEILLDRQALHAQQVAFLHPTTGERLQITAPLPPDIERLLLILRELPAAS